MELKGRIFGTSNLKCTEFVRILCKIDSDFSVFVFGDFEQYGVSFALECLKSHMLITNLVFIDVELKNLINLQESLNEISNFGCEIYCFFTKCESKELSRFMEIAKSALIFIA